MSVQTPASGARGSAPTSEKKQLVAPVIGRTIDIHYRTHADEKIRASYLAWIATGGPTNNKIKELFSTYPRRDAETFLLRWGEERAKTTDPYDIRPF
eukprot:3096745-Amphidinium_carterae.3